jgi:hypothetical protein
MHIIGSQADTRFYTKGVPMVNNSLFISQYGIGVSKFRPFYIKKERRGNILKGELQRAYHQHTST